MTAIHNEQTKLLATALNNVAVAYVVIGFVTPMTALSFRIASAPAARFETLSFSVVWLFNRGDTTSGGAAGPAEPQAMTFDWYFVTFGIPAITLIIAYGAVLANERATRRLDHRQPGE